MLVTLDNGQDRLIASSKSGEVFGLDPDNKGKIVWQTRLGRGGLNGGILWGGASDGKIILMQVLDRATADSSSAGPGPGFNALSPATGAVIWHITAPPPRCAWSGPCERGHNNAPAVIPGVVFTRTMDGRERAYSVGDGKVLWETDAGTSFAAVNGGMALGGSIEQSGQVIAGGMVYVSSGARTGQPGNALLAYSVRGE
jgi:polyvinyl alcohol dehydrogenase (cytochrome)